MHRILVRQFICVVYIYLDLPPAQMAIRIKFEAQIMNQIDLADFFLVRAASLFMLRTFSAQINCRVKSRKVLFDLHRFLSNKSPIILLERVEKEICLFI
jgi:hypothetical protein